MQHTLSAAAAPHTLCTYGRHISELLGSLQSANRTIHGTGVNLCAPADKPNPNFWNQTNNMNPSLLHYSTLTLGIVIAAENPVCGNPASIVVQLGGKPGSSDTTCAGRWHFISRRAAVLTAVQPAVHCSTSFTGGEREGGVERPPSCF